MLFFDEGNLYSLLLLEQAFSFYYAHPLVSSDADRWDYTQATSFSSRRPSHRRAFVIDSCFDMLQFCHTITKKIADHLIWTNSFFFNQKREDDSMALLGQPQFFYNLLLTGLNRTQSNSLLKNIYSRWFGLAGEWRSGSFALFWKQWFSVF